jgi:hypothetical protein
MNKEIESISSLEKAILMKKLFKPSKIRLITKEEKVKWIWPRLINWKAFWLTKLKQLTMEKEGILP